MGLIRGCVRYSFMALFNLRLKVEEFGKENLPKKGGYVLCSNHVHWMDPIVYVCENKRKVYAIAKEELFSNPFKAWVMRRLALIPVKRDARSNNNDSIEEDVYKLKKGELVLIYPEGTRFGLKKGIKPKKGAALMALEARVPIIPMAIVGSFKPNTKMRVIFDKPMDISEYYPKEGERVNLRNLVTVTNKVMDRIVELRDQINTPEIEKEMNEAEEEREKKKQLKLAKKEEQKKITGD